MIGVRLDGGLGNQMFQYAAARALAVRHNTPLFLDYRLLERNAEGQTPRSYELNVFDIQAQPMTDACLKALLYRRAHRKLLVRLKVMKRRSGLIAEPHFHYWPGFETIRDDSYLVGSWQSPRYFKDCTALIRQEFFFCRPWTHENYRLAKIIGKSESVAVHVRRGDYITNEQAAKLHPTCSPRYYLSAFEIIKRLVPDAHFYFFSDDPEYVRHHLQTQQHTVVSHNLGKSAFEDMRLMSLCKHHIIANSTFSWWGAWLGQHQRQVVITPSPWFSTQERETIDLVPAWWLQVPAN